jgi:hypothetical protein
MLPSLTDCTTFPGLVDLQRITNCTQNTVMSYVMQGSSNGSDIETKANESFDNGVFFYEAKRTPSIEQNLVYFNT